MKHIFGQRKPRNTPPDWALFPQERHRRGSSTPYYWRLHGRQANNCIFLRCYRLFIV